MSQFNQTGGASVGYLHQTHHERRTPSVDASSVKRWIIAPSILAAVLGGALFSGIGLAGEARSTFGFVVGMALFGAGLVGNAILIIRVLTFDKSPQIVIDQRTPVQIETAQRPAQTISGNRPVMVPTQEPAKVEHGGRSYSFSPTQLRLMIDRIEAENTAVARDPFQIATADYNAVRDIMSALGYWRVERVSVEWTAAGISWLAGRMRVVNG